MRHNLSPEEHVRLHELQERLEDNAYSEGMARFRKQLNKAEEKGVATSIGGTKMLLRGGITKMETAIELMWAPRPKGKHAGGQRHVAAKWCKLAGAEVAAYMTLKVVLDQLGMKNTVSATALMVTDMLLDELRYRRFREKAPQLFNYKLKNFHTSSYAHMARSMNASMKIAEIDCSDLDMPRAQKMRVGIKLIDILIECTQIVERNQRRIPSSNKKKIRHEDYLQATEDTAKWLDTRNGVLEVQHPVVMPMVVPPLAWGPNIRGGFCHALHTRSKLDFVRRVTGDMQKVISAADIPVVYETVNTLQNTAWRVNDEMLRTVTQIIATGGALAGIPASDDQAPPTKPTDIATNEDAKKAWKRANEANHRLNNSVRQRRVSLSKTLSVANTLRTEAAIYFPYSLDFRGRMYPVASYFTPQGEDLSRALLTFADGKALDDDGIAWLSIHGANCLGATPEGQKVSKMTLDARKAWVFANSQAIIEVADDPFESLWWTEADKPLQFLAFCFEWRNLIRANDAGEEYVCSLPCSMDGSCNGLQHFSALLKDEVGGRAVNLVPQDTPQDIYSVVSDTVLRLLTDAAASGDEIAALWLGLHASIGIVDRKLTKRPTMTFGYGSKQFGFTAQIHEYLKGHEQFAKVVKHFSEEGTGRSRLMQACEMMSKRIWESLSEVVVAAFEGMDWMQKATRGITSQNKAVQWTVPITGFPVRQEYSVVQRQVVITILAGSATKLSVYHPTDKVDSRKQANAVAPNFVHSLDAAALMLTVEAAFNEGVENFSMIHDSYGTLPADCSVLARCCRQSFAKLYVQRDIVALLYAELAAQWQDSAKCPAPPAKGTLDVSQVLASTYFFA